MLCYTQIKSTHRKHKFNALCPSGRVPFTRCRIWSLATIQQLIGANFKMFGFQFWTLEGPLFWWAAHLSTNVSDEAVKFRTKSRANGNAVTRTRRAKFKQQNWRENSVHQQNVRENGVRKQKVRENDVPKQNWRENGVPEQNFRKNGIP